METYDVVSIGGGPGGSAAAQQAALHGARACLIECRDLGGTCLNRGCMPSKAMLAASHDAWRMRHADRFTFATAEPQVDGRAFMKRVADYVASLRAATDEKIADNERVDLIRGRGRLTGPDTVAVETAGGTVEVRGRSIVIATGSTPYRPDGFPWDSGLLMTSDEAVAMDELPASVTVVGGGPLGCELATVYAELGIETLLVEKAGGLLRKLDVEAGQAVLESLKARGVEVVLACEVCETTADGDGVATTLADGQIRRSARALIAVGRRAVLDDIGLDAAGVERADAGYIPVDDRCRTNVDGIYAVGDVAGPLNHSHLAARMGVIAGENAVGNELSDDLSVVPVGVYTHPQVARVGLGEEDARSRYGDVRVLRYSYETSGTARAYAENVGQVKLTILPEDGRIVGGLWIGSRAVDMIHEIAVAMRHGVTVEQLYHTIHAHPGFQEALHGAVERYVESRISERS